MSVELDCRGMSCPEPVLRVRNELEKKSPKAVKVLVDNEAAKQNVCRFLEHLDYRVEFKEDSGGILVLGICDDLTGDIITEPSVPVGNESDGQTRKILVLITSTHMGHGDDGLGDMLMFNFLKTLKEMGNDLWRLVFVNGGVSFTAEGSDAVPFLRELAADGVKIMACGACLAYFHILDKIQVGEVTNMLEIVTAMKSADTVVTI